MVNQVNYVFAMSETMEPFRHTISMVPLIAGAIRNGQGNHSTGSGERGETLRGRPTDLPGHRLVQVRVGILLTAEVV